MLNRKLFSLFTRGPGDEDGDSFEKQPAEIEDIVTR